MRACHSRRRRTAHIPGWRWGHWGKTEDRRAGYWRWGRYAGCRRTCCSWVDTTRWGVVGLPGPGASWRGPCGRMTAAGWGAWQRSTPSRLAEALEAEWLCASGERRGEMGGASRTAHCMLRRRRRAVSLAGQTSARVEVGAARLARLGPGTGRC